MDIIDLDIPSAAEAKKTYDQGRFEKAQTQGMLIAKQIKVAIEDGRTNISVPDIISSVQKALETKGYKVKYNGSSIYDNSSTYTISWD
jgi:hypothetical protein